MTKPVIHFSHANGIPSKSYRYFFEQLSDFQFIHIDRMGYHGPDLVSNWYHLADELIAHIESFQHLQPVIGMGHSAGAVVTLIAATKRPELFSQLVFFDPPLFSKRKRLVIRMAKNLGLGDNIGPIKRTLVRKSEFDSLDEAHEYFKPKSLFKDFHPQCLADYVEAALAPTEQGFELAIEPLHEANIFRSILTRKPRGIDKVKGTLIYGLSSDVFNQHDARWWQKSMPLVECRGEPGGHLLVLEQPEAVARVVREIVGG